MDTTSKESVLEAAKTVEKEFGRLDVLVNNAGILPEMKKLADSDPDVWWQTMNVNVRGPYLTSWAFLPLLLKTSDGMKAICNVASVGALVVMPSVSAYQTSKLAVVRMTEFVAKEYAEEGICCFSIHPGNVVTDILGPDGPGDALKHIFTETVDLPADTIVYLTKERREWLNGRYINVTWDMPELESKIEEIVEKNLLKVKFVYQ
jgi:NAD(P)-dependent dehydrogenase (short-subunit alcohol dehydrogenase family)